MAWSFWQYVCLETPVSRPRMARWGATMAAAMLVMLAVPTFAGAYTLNLFATRRYIPIGPANPTSPGFLNITPAPMGWSTPDFSHFDPLEVATTIQDTLRQTWLGNGYVGRHGPDGLIWLIGATLMPPVVLLALPHTRKRAKVRLAHVVRAWAYSASWLVLFCCCGVMLLWLAVGLDIKDLLDAQLADPETRYADWFVALGIMRGGRSGTVSNFLGVWLMVFWWFAITRGWRIRGADAVATIVSVAVCSLLAGLALQFWVSAYL